MKDFYAQLKAKTGNIIQDLDSDFYILKTSYKSLKIYELISEIIKLREQKVFDITMNDDQEVNKVKFLELLNMPTNFDDEKSIDLAIKESFFLGMICTALVHANIPLPKDLYYFGKVINDQFVVNE